ncbi:YfhO family protein [Streptomyces sp. NPDC003042]
MLIQGVYPFGARSRAVNDLGNQFVPFHAHLWDLMHGNTSGDLFFNWGSGFGVPFLADFFTYLMNPFSWLVGLVPRDMVELPIALVTILSIGLGTGLMAMFLGCLSAGPPWLRALLAVGYGVSSWTTSDGWADPMWMWGLVSFPLLGIAGDWCLRRCRWVPGALVVTLCWAGNFYTAAMATLGMGLVFGVRLLLDVRPARERGRVLLRALSMTVVGVLLAAPVVTVSYQASKTAQPAPGNRYNGPPDVRDYLAHLLPGGYHVTTPRIAVGILALLLVFTFPFMRRIPRPERAAWCVMLVLVALSYVWEPAILLWHGGALPNGSPYRAAIALTAMLVATAWLALSYRPGPREIWCGGSLLAVLLVTVSGSPYVSPGTWILTVAGGIVSAVLLCLLWRHPVEGPARRTVVCALTVSVFLGAAGATSSVTAIRDQEEWWKPKRTLDADSFAAYGQVRTHDTWPVRRSDPGPHEFAANDPMLLGGEGGSYYSSYVPAQTARTLQGLGAGLAIGGRHLLSFEDPVGRAIMGISSYLEPDTGAPNGFARRSQQSPPVVTLRPVDAALDGAVPDDASVFDRRNRVLGTAVYNVPELIPAPDSGGRRQLHAGTPTTLTARCTAGTTIYLYAPWYAGTVQAFGTTTTLRARRPMSSSAILPLGRVTSSADFTLTFTAATTQSIPRYPLGCLDHRVFDETVARLTATGPAKITAGGHSINAVFASGTTGTAVLAIPAVHGWRCSSGSRTPTAPGTLGGLIAVSLDPTSSRITCAYHTPGLASGLALSGVALTVLLLTTAAGTVSRRRTFRLGF